MPSTPEPRYPVAERAAEIAVAPLSQAQKKEMLYWLKLNRALETQLANLYKQGKVLGGLYRGLGQEAISVGSAYALEPGDWYAPVIRNIGTCLVRGVPLRVMFSQYMAKSVPMQGRDNALHFGDVSQGMVATISPLGGLVSVMAGVALAFKIRRERKVALTYSGDGQTSTGAWHEGINFAAVQNVPFVLIVENNQFAYSTPVSRQCLLKDLADKGKAYGIPGVVVDGNDVLAMYETTKRAVERARAGFGPTLIEAKTFRRLGHSEHDDPRKYVPEALFAEWEKKDPIERFERHVIEEKILTRAGITEIEKRIDAELAEAQRWAEECPHPQADEDSLTRGIFAES
jgi:TPP-dependent pyruvate/acetoin dehydrogenase alpha subunit